MMKQIKLKGILKMSALLIAASSFTTLYAQQASTPQYFVNVSMAADSVPLKHQTLVQPDPDSGLPAAQELITDGGATAHPEYGVSVGKTFAINTKWSTQIGLGFYYNGAQTVTGRYYATPYTPGSFNPATKYHYAVKNQRYMLNSEFLYHPNKRFAYIAGFGLGLSRNESSAIVFAEGSGNTPPNSAKVRQNAMAFSVNVGLDYTLCQKWHVSAKVNKQWNGDYSIAVDNGNAKATPIALKQGQLAPWAYQLSLSYLF